MKAIRIEQHGGPEVLQPQHIRMSDPGAGEVLVRTAHAGINVMDVGTRKGAFELEDRPRSPANHDHYGGGGNGGAGRRRRDWFPPRRPGGLLLRLEQSC